MSELLANTTAAIATVSTELSSSGTSLVPSAAAPVELRGAPFRIRMGTEVSRVIATGASGASPWTLERNVEQVVGGSGAVAHAVGVSIFHVLTVGGLTTAEAMGPRAIEAGAVTQPKIAPYAVGPGQIEAEAITADKYADLSIETDAIGEGEVTEEKLTQGAEGKLVPTGGSAGEVLKRKATTETEWGTVSSTFYFPAGFNLIGEPEVGIAGGVRINLFTGQTCQLVRADYKIATGTHVKCKILKAGTLATGFEFTATGTEADVEPTAVSVTNGQKLQLEITEATGNPKNLEVTLTLKMVIAS